MRQEALFDDAEGVTRRHKCEECGGPFDPYARAESYQKYCSHGCRQRAYRKEQDARNRGMTVAAAKSAGCLEKARELARELGREGWTISIEDVRELATDRGLELPWGNWTGSVFKGDGWMRAGFVQARHKGSHCRVVSLWRLEGA